MGSFSSPSQRDPLSIFHAIEALSTKEEREKKIHCNMESDMESYPGYEYDSFFADPDTGELVRVDEHLGESESDWGTWPEPNRKLAIATRDGTAAEALICLQQGGNPDDIRMIGFFINAAEHGKLEIVRHWLSFSKEEIGCDRNTYALQYACKEKRIAVIRYLLTAGVPLYPNSAYLWRAVKHRNDAVARLLLEYGNVNSHALFVVGENAKMVHCLVKYSCDVNVLGNKGRTPLHVACRDGHLQTAKALKGAYPSALDSFGWTPLHYACRNGHFETAKWLVTKAGANPGPPRDRGDSFFDARINWRRVSVDPPRRWLNPMQMFALGIDPWERDGGGNTFLHHVVKQSAVLDVRQLLQEASKLIEARNHKGQTPLFLASEFHTISLLVEQYQADTTARDHAKRTPLLNAAACIHGEPFRFLAEQRHVSLEDRDVPGSTALHWQAFH
jgi:ankyrin repeat protein